MLVLALALARVRSRRGRGRHATTSTRAPRPARAGATGRGPGRLSPASSSTRTAAAAASLIGLRIDGGKAIANGASAAITFTSPPGTTIADFALDRHLDFRSNPPLANTRPLYALYLLGGVPFIGAGDYHTPTRKRLNGVRRLVRLSGGERDAQPAHHLAAAVRGAGRLQGRRHDAVDPGRLLQARHQLLRAGRRPRLPRAVRHRRDGQRPAAAGPDRVCRGAAGRRPAQRLGPRRAPRHRQRRHPARRAARRHGRRGAAARGRGGLHGGQDRRRRDLLRAPGQALPGARAARPCARPRSRSAGASSSCARSTPAATPPTAGRTRSTSPPPRTAARSTASARRRRAR